MFVRASSGSGRLDLGPELVRLLKDLARATERTSTPFVTCFFGNPYTASFVPELPAMLLTYDFYDQPERAAVRALAGRGGDRREAADHAVAAVPRRPRPRPPPSSRESVPESCRQSGASGRPISPESVPCRTP